MSAINAEDCINQFCVFNLPRDLSEALERLSSVDKFLAAASSVGSTSMRGSKAHECLTALMNWRNAFAHGHCTDRPTKSLRHNHLISPEYYESVPLDFQRCIQFCEHYYILDSALRKVSKNEYLKGSSYEMNRIAELTSQLRKYQFAFTAPGGSSYDLIRKRI
jgi:hypothetical protein